MNLGQLLGETLKEAPPDLEDPSTALLARAGWLRPLPGGGLALLPLGEQALRRVAAALGEALGVQPLGLPAGPPGGEAAAAERAVLELCRSELKSWRQLPLELGAEGACTHPGARSRAGLLAPREARVLHLVVLGATPGLPAALLERLHAALVGLGLHTERVPTRGADGRPGLALWRPGPGEDRVHRCACGWQATPAAAAPVPPEPSGEEALPLQEVFTPGARTIEALAGFLGVPRARTCKAVFTWAEAPEGPGRLVLALVRGDQEVNLAAVSALSGARALRPARDEEIRAAGLVPGFGSAVGLAPGRALVLVDPAVAATPNLVAGANHEEHHLLNTCCGRDYHADHVAPIAAFVDGGPCPACGAPTRTELGVELGRLVDAGSAPAERQGVSFTSAEGQRRAPSLAVGHVDLTRTLGALVDTHRDAQGLRLPRALNPAPLVVLSLARKPEAQAAAQAVVEALRAAGLRPDLDDRDLSPGAKFADCELRGALLRVIVSDRGVAQGTVELKARGGEPQQVPLAEVVVQVLQALRAV